MDPAPPSRPPTSSKDHLTRARRRPYSLGPAPDDVHAARADPQFLHHRAHRPREVDARRPHPATHRRRRRAVHARPVPRPHGHRARAWHHDQVAERAAALDRRRRRKRNRVCAAPDRHARARRLHLRGVPVVGRLRGRGAAGGRGAGHRSADASEPVPGAGERPGHHPGAEQDRSAGRPAGAVRPGDRACARRIPGRRAARIR